MISWFGPKPVQDDAAGFTKTWVNPVQESRTGCLHTAGTFLRTTTQPGFKPSRAEIHAEGIRVTRTVVERTCRRRDLDIRARRSGAARTTEIVAGNARLSVEDRPEPITAMASRVILHPQPLEQFAPRGQRFVGSTVRNVPTVRSAG
jgi:hypothetical protein